MANPVFSCPKCRQLLGDIPASGELTAVCVRCRLKFQVVRGRVADADSRQITMRHQDSGHDSFRQAHQLRLRLSTGRVEVASFELPSSEAQTVARPGDIVSVVYLMRGSRRDELLSVHNATTGQSLLVSLPSEKATVKAWSFGVASGFAVLVATVAAGVPGVFAAGAALVTVVGLGIGLGHRFMPRADLSPEQEAQLNSAQRLLAEKLDLEAARSRVIRDLEHQRGVRDRLNALRAKMVKVGLELYGPRIAALDAALATIERQVELETRLCDGYEKSIQMLEIEIEAGATADALDSAATLHIAETLAEMRDLESEQAELGRQLAANVEVENLLRNGTS
jgi:hypothetical protein